MSEKSLICPVSNSKSAKERAVREAEEFALSTGLSKKASLRIRLVAEELLGLVGVVLNVENGEFYIEENDGLYELHLHAETPLSHRVKGLLMSVSAERKNTAYSGFTGMLRNVFDSLTNSEQWGLAGWSYRKERENESLSKWDELERSVLVRLCDDISVSLRNKSADIVAKVKFN